MTIGHFQSTTNVFGERLVVQVVNSSYFVSSLTTDAICAIRFNVDGTVDKRDSPPNPAPYTPALWSWCTPSSQAPDDYEIGYTITGDALDVGLSPEPTFYPLTVAREYVLIATGPTTNNKTCQLTFTIVKGTGGPVVATGVINLAASWNDGA